MNQHRLIVVLLLLMTRPSLSQSVKLCEVKVDNFETEEYLKQKGLIIPRLIQNSAISGLIDHFYSYGFLEAEYILNSSDSSCTFNIYPGKQYKWINLDKGNLPQDIVDNLKFKSISFENRIFEFKYLVKLFNEIVIWSENNGYPFGNIRIKRIKIHDQGIEASLDYNSGPDIEFDTISISGTNKINKNFLYAYLQIWPQHTYDKSKVKLIPGLIKQLPGFELEGDPEEYFTNGKCNIKLSLKVINANGFNGYLGIMPNENDPDKILITGQLNLKLNNLFKSSKGIALNWDRPNLLSQDLNLRYSHPCLFNSPLNGSLQGSIFKQDTAFFNTFLLAGFDIRKIVFGRIGAELSYFSSRVLKKDQINTTSINQLADLNILYYGINYLYSQLDNNDFPVSGWETGLSIKAGIKRINSFGGPDSIGTLQAAENNLQMRATASLAKFTRINKISTILTRFSGGLINDNYIFLNDMYRLGGLSSIRGFNENYFYSSKYLYGNIEYRLLVEKKSYLLIFTDMGLIYNDLIKTFKTNYPISVGGGFSLATPLGSLELLIAIGREKNQPLDIRYSKFHVGYSSRF